MLVGVAAGRRGSRPIGGAGEDAGGAQAGDLPLRRGVGQSEQVPDVRVGAAGVLGEGVHDTFVEIVQHSGWFTYFFARRDRRKPYTK